MASHNKTNNDLYECLTSYYQLELGTAGCSLRTLYQSYHLLEVLSELPMAKCEEELTRFIERLKSDINSGYQVNNEVSEEDLTISIYIYNLKYILNECESILMGKSVHRLEDININYDNKLITKKHYCDFVTLISDAFIQKFDEPCELINQYFMLQTISDEVDNNKSIELKIKDDYSQLKQEFDKQNEQIKRLSISTISVLSIFSAIVISFIGGFQELSYILKNTDITNIFSVMANISICGLLLYNIIYFLFYATLHITGIFKAFSNLIKAQFWIVNSILVLLLIISLVVIYFDSASETSSIITIIH